MMKIRQISRVRVKLCHWGRNSNCFIEKIFYYGTVSSIVIRVCNNGLTKKTCSKSGSIPDKSSNLCKKSFKHEFAIINTINFLPEYACKKSWQRAFKLREINKNDIRLENQRKRNKRI